MTDASHEQALTDLVMRLQQRQLGGMARIVLDIVEPFGFLASQLAVFARPLTPRGRWHSYMAALSDETSWNTLRQMVDE